MTDTVDVRGRKKARKGHDTSESKGASVETTLEHRSGSKVEHGF